MREMGLESIRSGAKKQFEDETRKCQNLVRRQFKTDRPDQIWVSDVTYYRLKDKQYLWLSALVSRPQNIVTEPQQPAGGQRWHRGSVCS